MSHLRIALVVALSASPASGSAGGQVRCGTYMRIKQAVIAEDATQCASESPVSVRMYEWLTNRFALTSPGNGVRDVPDCIDTSDLGPERCECR